STKSRHLSIRLPNPCTRNFYNSINCRTTSGSCYSWLCCLTSTHRLLTPFSQEIPTLKEVIQNSEGFAGLLTVAFCLRVKPPSFYWQEMILENGLRHSSFLKRSISSKSTTYWEFLLPLPANHFFAVS